MALTPEDVIGKTFLPTRFQEGYNQDEVDDFLDEVVTALRGLRQENDDLRAELSSCRARCAELSNDAPSPGAGGIDLDKGGRDPQAAPAPVAPAAGAQGPSGADSSSSAAGVLALAQRLHDEHIAAGQKQREAMVAEAEQLRTATLSSLQTERDQLQARIDSLRDFEHEYRSRLKSFLQAQLGDLEAQSSLEPEPSGS